MVLGLQFILCHYLVAAIGLEFLLSQISKSELRYLIFLVFSSYLFVVSANPNYEQTTRPFNNEKYSEVLEIINSSDSDILIYHGGLQTTALYTEKDIYLEDVSYFSPEVELKASIFHSLRITIFI